MSRLSSVLDGASGSDFLTFVGAAAVARSGHMGGSSASGGRSGSSSSRTHNGSSGLGAVIGLLLQHMPAAGATDAQQHLSEGDGVGRSLLADARQVRG